MHTFLLRNQNEWESFWWRQNSVLAINMQLPWRQRKMRSFSRNTVTTPTFCKVDKNKNETEPTQATARRTGLDDCQCTKDLIASIVRAFRTRNKGKRNSLKTQSSSSWRNLSGTEWELHGLNLFTTWLSLHSYIFGTSHDKTFVRDS